MACREGRVINNEFCLDDREVWGRRFRARRFNSPGQGRQEGQEDPTHNFVPACEFHFGPVTMGKLSVRKGEAGRPSLFHRFTTGKSAQPKRTATGLVTSGQLTTTLFL